MDPATKKSEWKSDLVRRLHDPTQLRWMITAAILLIGTVAVYQPLSGRAEAIARKNAVEKNRLALVRDIEMLRTEYQKVKPWLPVKSDSNEWIQYMLGGIGRCPVKLLSLDSDLPKSLGPYKVVVLRVALEGTFADLDTFLYWLDTNDRLLRVDVVRLEPQAKGGMLVLQLTILGVLG